MLLLLSKIEKREMGLQIRMKGDRDSIELITFFDGLLDVLSDGIYISDASGKTLKVNRQYEQLTGLKRDDVIGKLVTDLQAEGNYDVVLNPDIVRTGEGKTSVQITKLGRTVILNGYPVFDETGKVALVVTFVRDVTVLSHMKEQLEKQKVLIDSYQQGANYSSPKKGDKCMLVTESQAMILLMNSLKIIAKTDATVLLLGETGVGKDVLARKIHENSLRCNRPFFKVDCTSIPNNLVESELFGYEAGAFSGANTKGKPGFFEMADGGTLFLDEVGELPFPIQAKLLRVLQDQEIIRVGSTKVTKVNARFIAATNRNLEEAVKEGTFRSDLFYRLRVAVLEIPPLRRRVEDILPLANCFIEKFNAKYKKNMMLSQDVKKVFENYQWPGNIREIENLIQSLIVTRDKELIEVGDLPNSMVPAAVNVLDNKSLNDIMGDIEKEILQKALHSYGSIAEVAKAFKVDRTTIFRKLKKYSLIE
jgi:PAS domain S-box-containing protein